MFSSFLEFLPRSKTKRKHHDVIGVHEGVETLPDKAANHEQGLWGDDHCLIRHSDDVDGFPRHDCQGKTREQQRKATAQNPTREWTSRFENSPFSPFLGVAAFPASPHPGGQPACAE